MSGIHAPTSLTVICTRRGLEKSMDGVWSCVGRWIFSMIASVAACTCEGWMCGERGGEDGGGIWERWVAGHTTGRNCLVGKLFLCNMSCFIPLHSAASSHSSSSCTHSCSLARTVLLHMYMHNKAEDTIIVWVKSYIQQAAPLASATTPLICLHIRLCIAPDLPAWAVWCWALGQQLLIYVGGPTRNWLRLEYALK